MICTSLFWCKPEEIILHLDISGSVKDALNNEPIADAFIILIPSNDTVLSGNDGAFLFKNLTPGNYELQASKKGYEPDSKSIIAYPENTYNIDFGLNGAPIPNISTTYLNFGFDSTTLAFRVSNTGQAKLTYLFVPSQEWISVHPSSGEVSNETDTIVVTINKSGLPEKTFKEAIKMFSVLGKDLQLDTIKVYLNGVMDISTNYYYKTVRIGSQMWMAENINVGELISSFYAQANNHIIEKYCYDNLPDNCKIYGGLYKWDEMMQYNPSDSGIIGTTQGICPVGWHIPTVQESALLLSFDAIALKESNPIYWPLAGSDEATNESGFSAIPAGFYNGDKFTDKYYQDDWWTSTEYKDLDKYAWFFGVWYTNDYTALDTLRKAPAFSVRCIKN
jgi:uncharacterized protein (TIGR02145 family)